MKQDQYQPLTLLVVEDSDEDFEALSRIVDRVSTFDLVIYRCIDGDDALDFLNLDGKYRAPQDRPNPNLIVLDLNLPGTDGREVLATIKATQSLKTIPVVVLSTSSDPKDVAVCYQSGANSYMLKPMKLDKLRETVQTMLNYWFKATILPTSCDS
jgi:CheY-like chemotaxis protein